MGWVFMVIEVMQVKIYIVYSFLSYDFLIIGVWIDKYCEMFWGLGLQSMEVKGYRS